RPGARDHRRRKRTAGRCGRRPDARRRGVREAPHFVPGLIDKPPSRFARWLLPGLGVKAVVIGGGYATGRELAEFFLSRGPWGGLFAILFSTLLFSIFCSLTFVAARRFQTYDYKSFFKQLLGPAWHLFEVAYLIFVVLILAVYGAAAGAIGNAVFGAPLWIGTALLALCIAVIVAFGNKAVERL